MVRDDDFGGDDGDGEAGEDSSGRSRREFLRALGGAVGVALVADPTGLAGLAEAAGGGSLPSGYVFHRVLTIGGGAPALDDVEEILPGVMINDRSEVIFHARTASNGRAVYRMRITRDRRPRARRPRLIVESGQELADGVIVERIAAGDTNPSGAYVTVIRGAKDFEGVYIQRPGRELSPLIKAGDRTPGKNGRYTGSFGDVDLAPNGTLLLAAHYSVPGKFRQGLFALPHGRRRGGRTLLRTGHRLPNSKAMVTGIGLVERRGRYFIAQVFGRRPKQRRKSMRLEPSGFLVGRVDRGRRGMRLLTGARQLRPARKVLRGISLVGPRVHRDGTAATVVHRKSRHLQLHRHRRGSGRAKLVETGDRTGHGSGVRTISAPVFGHDGRLFYRVISKRAMELLVVGGGEARRILESGDRIGGQRVKVFNLGWHTDQVDGRGRLAFQAELDDGRTAIVVGTPV